MNLLVEVAPPCKIVEIKSKCDEDIMECVTIEIVIKKTKIISSPYRAPASCVDIFKDQSVELYKKIINRKIVFVYGNININLFNPHGHEETTDFINTMNSVSLYYIISNQVE